MDIIEWREYQKLWKREWRRKFPEKEKRNKRRYYDRHREECIQRGSRWRRLHPEKNREIMRKRINMAGNISLLLWKNLKTGACSKCSNKVGEGCKRTSLHHALGYFTILPWFGLEELCNSCHAKTSGLGRLYGRGGR